MTAVEALMWVAQRMDVLALTEPTTVSYEALYRQLRREVSDELGRART